MNKRKAIISLVFTFLILLIGMILYKLLESSVKEGPPPQKTKIELRTVAVQQLKASTLNNKITIDGRLSAYKSVQLSANVSGIIKPNSKEIKKGMYFKKGALLFDIDERKATFSLFAMRSNLQNAITQIMPDLKLDYPDAYQKWNTYLENFDVEKTTPPLPKVVEKQEKYFVVARNIFNQYYNIKSAETQLSEFKIYAPFSGVITNINVFPGGMVVPGQPLAMMINGDQYELEAPISESEIQNIKIGNSALLHSNSSDKTWQGKVVRISNKIDPATQSIPIFISVRGNDLKEGMYLRGSVESNPMTNTIAISKKNIVNQENVFCVKDSLLFLQKLDIKTSNEDYVFVSNFDAENWVVLEDPKGLEEGLKVNPVTSFKQTGN